MVELQDIVGHCIYLNTHLSLMPIDKKNLFVAASSAWCDRSPFLELFSTWDCSSSKENGELRSVFSLLILTFVVVNVKPLFSFCMSFSTRWMVFIL